MSSQLGSNYLYVNSLYLQNLIANLQKVGGIIFYIDTSSTNSYTFYNSTNFSTTSAPSVGSDYTNYYYTKEGTSKDKYYVYYPTKITGTWGYSNKTVTGDATALESIGTGRATTQSVLGNIDTSTDNDTIWRALLRFNASKLNGCSDWYIGSEDELVQLKNQVGASTFYYCWCNRDSNSTQAFYYSTNKGFYPENKTTSHFTYIIRSF